MKRTVRTVLRTSMGIIVIRKPRNTRWGFIETRCVPPHTDWKEAAAQSIYQITGIPVPASSLNRIRRKARRGTRREKRSRIIYTHATVSDIRVMTDIKSRSEDGTRVVEMTYQMARDGCSMHTGDRKLLLAHGLLSPP